jgi:hypothetical protein
MFLHLLAITVLLIIPSLAFGQTSETDTLTARMGDSRKLETERAKVDSIERAFEEWVRNMPIADKSAEGEVLKPIESDFKKMVKPNDSIRQQLIAFKIKMPKNMMPIDNRLETTKSFQRNQSGAMTVGINIFGVLEKLFPKRKRMSKKEREREKLRRILENY